MPSEKSDHWQIGTLSLSSRLIMGSGRYPSQQLMIDSLCAGGTELVTVSLRRINLKDTHEASLIQVLKKLDLALLPNTAGCYTVKDALLTAELAREALETDFLKLELIADKETLYPDVEKLLEAAKELVKMGFQVLPYTLDDPVTCKKLEDLGCVAIMPLGAPIGSGMGILNPYHFELIRRAISRPLILDAGIGTASDVVKAMELGCDGVLLDTAVAQCNDPVRMATAMALACSSGRQAFLAGRIPRKYFAEASSPSWGMFT